MQSGIWYSYSFPRSIHHRFQSPCTNTVSPRRQIPAAVLEVVDDDEDRGLCWCFSGPDLQDSENFHGFPDAWCIVLLQLVHIPCLFHYVFQDRGFLMFLH